jgi:hypothetical protein
MATAQGREAGQQRAIGSALGISRERVREIVKREERCDQRTRELFEGLEKAQDVDGTCGKSPAVQRGSSAQHRHDFR